MSDNGKLIVIEGPDGAGKSTLAKGLKNWLKIEKNLSCDLLAFPGNEPGTLGHHVYEFHHDPLKFGVKKINSASLQLLHIAAHIDAINSQIVPKLENGITVILDRYWWSTWVYGEISGVDKTALRLMINVEMQFWGNHLPWCLFLIDRDKSLRENVSIQNWKSLRNVYLELYNTEKNEYPVFVVENQTTPEMALGKILDIIEENFQ